MYSLRDFDEAFKTKLEKATLAYMSRESNFRF